MGSHGVSEVGAGAGAGAGGRVGRMENALGSTAGPGASGDGRSVGAEIHVHNQLAEVGVFCIKVPEGGLVRRSWVEGSE